VTRPSGVFVADQLRRLIAGTVIKPKVDKMPIAEKKLKNENVRRKIKVQK